jgi:hypothetical protein
LADVRTADHPVSERFRAHESWDQVARKLTYPTCQLPLLT